VRKLISGLVLLVLLASPVAAQSVGAIAGVVREQGDSNVAPLSGLRVSVDNGRFVTTTDGRGTYRVREVQAGWHTVRVAGIGYRSQLRDSVLVRAGQTTSLDFRLKPDPVGLAPLEVIADRVDSVLDPLAVQDQQRFTAEDLRRLPVSSVEEAIALSSGAVGESYRGGRLGQQAFVLDGLGLKNQLDASTGGLGLRVPPELLAEASLVTNGFSARYGQAVSALVNLATRDGADKWGGRLSYETDRPLGDGADYGLDRSVLSVEGPLPFGIRVLAVADLSGKLDAEPVNAPSPSNRRDPRWDKPDMLPHNSGEQSDFAAKLMIPLGARQTLRILGLHSVERRYLFDPAYKYDQAFAPSRRVTGNLLNAHLQRTFANSGVTADVRVGYFEREFMRGSTQADPDYKFGAFTTGPLDILGSGYAVRQDTAAARNALPGFIAPDYSSNTPWGVPGFFLGEAARGDIAWNHFRELRGRFDLSIPAGSTTDFYFGGEYSGQQVKTFQRVLAYLPVGGDVPAATAANFTPWSGAIYSEMQARSKDLALTVGVRYDQFSGRDDLPGVAAKTKRALSPRLAVSTVFKGATFVASFGKFQQAPDYQYLVDAAFDDTLRTGRSRSGNPDLGFENSTQYEFSLRVRPTKTTSVRTNLYIRRLDGLVGSVPLGVDPDSSIFGNADAGSVKGIEFILEREFKNYWGVRISYNLMEAMANSSNAFLTRRAGEVDPVTGIITPAAKVEFPLDYDRRHAVTAIASGTMPPNVGPHFGEVYPLSGIEATTIVRLASGLPFSRYIGDSLVGVPNEGRLPASSSIDLLLRRPLRVGRFVGSVFLDVRNIVNQRNIIAVRRDTGKVNLTEAGINQIADAAYNANPQPIPYESPRYRGFADADNNGYIEGAELQGLYRAAARDFAQPIFFYGPPRQFRLGMEVVF
jgi:hypothetical protein